MNPSDLLAVEAEAELRATVPSDLLDQMTKPNEYQPVNPCLRVAAYSAQDLLDEMVVLFRRALSEARGGAK
ncbi:hypothetical protein [Pseudomonas sp.]|uniref:hypothetical protein n=1 Tax=Pseudomonas sp. TaxID=306 RepID=UPI0031E0727E